MDSKLINGKIPANTECPFKKECPVDLCHHKDIHHYNSFSCGTARAFDLLCEDKNPDMFEWTVKIRVHKVWVADGFELTDNVANRMLEKLIVHAEDSEVKIENN